MKRSLTFLLSALLFATLGLAAGYYAARQTQTAGGHAAHGPHGDEAEEFPKSRLERLGIELQKVEPRLHSVLRDVQGVLRRRPGSRQRLSTPFGGVVQSLDRLEGSAVGSKDVVVTVLRDALPRPQPAWAESLLKPVNEELHEVYGELILAAKRAELAAAELQRQEALAKKSSGSIPLVSKQRLIELRYRSDEAKAARRVAESKLEAHGLSHEQIDLVARGGHPPLTHQLWRRALAHHGLWTEQARSIFEALPEAGQSLPRSTALVGELVAAGLCNDALAEAMKKSALLRERFDDSAALLLSGHSLPALLDIAERGGLDPVMRLRITGDTRLDLAEWHVEAGQRVAAGQLLAVLEDPSVLRLELEPVGEELLAVRAALESGVEFEAVPAIKGVGVARSGLRIRRIASHKDGRTVAYCDVPNQELRGDQASGARNWALFAGQRLVARVPLRVFEKPGLVLPREAAFRRGPEWHVFVQDGLFLDEKEVRVVYEDARHVVLSPDSLKTGASVVVRGTLAVRLVHEASDEGGHHHHH